MRTTVLLFTRSYPYSIGAENGFISQELEVLRARFARVWLIPTITGGDVEPVTAPNVTVNTDYARYRRSSLRRALFALGSILDLRFLREVRANALTWLRRPGALVQALREHVIARITESWIRRLPDVDWSNVVLYTWWFDGTTLGLSRFARRAGAPVITRAHGADLYESRQATGYIPFRNQSLEAVRQVFSVSDAGARYLSARYPEFRQKVHVSLLGVDDPGHLNQRSTDGVFRIASCSFLLPVKRIDLMIRGIARLGRSHPQRRFEWTHIGDGERAERAALESLARSTMPANVQYRFLKYPGRAGLNEFYTTQPVDVFINTSESEGTPVAIMEAMSFGIPIVATAVGGNVEIVTSDNGVVTSAHPEPDEIADALTSVLCDEARGVRLRAGSRERWQREYSAARNYDTFASAIQAL